MRVVFKGLLEKKMYRLTASDVAEFLTPARVQEIVQLAAAGKLSGGTGALEGAVISHHALCASHVWLLFSLGI